MKGYEEFPLPDEELVFVARPGIGIDDEAASLEQLTPYRLFTRVEECWSSVCLEENLQRLGKGGGRFKGITKLDDLHLIIHAVEDGAGVAYLSKHVVERQLKAGTLRAHYVDGFMHRSGEPLSCGKDSGPTARAPPSRRRFFRFSTWTNRRDEFPGGVRAILPEPRPRTLSLFYLCVFSSPAGRRRWRA